MVEEVVDVHGDDNVSPGFGLNRRTGCLEDVVTSLRQVLAEPGSQAYHQAVDLHLMYPGTVPKPAPKGSGVRVMVARGDDGAFVW